MDTKELMLEIKQVLFDEPRGKTFNQLKILLKVHPRMLKSALALLCMEGHAFSTGDNNSNLATKRYIHTSHANMAPPSTRPRVFEPYLGTDWSHATTREGCLDHEKYGSRRGDTIVPYHGIHWQD